MIVHIMLKVASAFFEGRDCARSAKTSFSVYFEWRNCAHNARSSFSIYFEGRDCAHSAKSSFSGYIVSPSENQMLAFFFFFFAFFSDMFHWDLWNFFMVNLPCFTHVYGCSHCRAFSRLHVRSFRNMKGTSHAFECELMECLPLFLFSKTK